MSESPDAALVEMGRVGTHVQFALSSDERRDLSAFIRRPWRPKLSPEEAGAFRMRTLGCAACHERALAPSLVDEGQRVQPQWLFAYLSSAPGASAKPFNLAKHDKGDKKSEMLPVMPTFALADDALNDIALALEAGHAHFETPPAARASLADCKSCHDAAAFSAMRGRLQPSWVESHLRTHPTVHDVATATALTGAVFAP